MRVSSILTKVSLDLGLAWPLFTGTAEPIA
jgi:hypothetical protein